MSAVAVVAGAGGGGGGGRQANFNLIPNKLQNNVFCLIKFSLLSAQLQSVYHYNVFIAQSAGLMKQLNNKCFSNNRYINLQTICTR
jgi:hypothetical protein